MVGDLREKMQASQGKLEQLIARIPGFGGYQRKEQRRDADKMLRLHVARQYEEQLRKLNDLQQSLISVGQISVMMTLESASVKLQLLIDRLKNATYGYAGLFDAIKIDEEALDKLYEFDENMLEGVQRIASLLGGLGEAIQSESSIGEQAKALVMEAQALNDTFSRRQDVILS